MDEPLINLTPLIDVVFLLLIFFMVHSYRETLLQVNLPEAEAETQSTQTERLEIVVSRNGSFALNGQTLVNGNSRLYCAVLNLNLREISICLSLSSQTLKQLTNQW